jgi:hypothetical protein
MAMLLESLLLLLPDNHQIKNVKLTMLLLLNKNKSEEELTKL